MWECSKISVVRNVSWEIIVLVMNNGKLVKQHNFVTCSIAFYCFLNKGNAWAFECLRPAHSKTARISLLNPGFPPNIMAIHDYVFSEE